MLCPGLKTCPSNATGTATTARQSALHSAAYLLYYLHQGGLRLLWVQCFPVPLVGLYVECSLPVA
jgi:hypothetical protein